MKNTVITFVFLTFSLILLGQNKPITLTLQQIEFKDNTLIKTISDLSKEQDCFSKNDFYILDFFQSSLSSGEYYLSINRFVVDDKIINSIAYYVVINDIVFFISNKVSVEIIKILPLKKEYKFNKKNTPIIVGDYRFLIWRTLGGYYHVLSRTCGE
ncbi:MAG: hypothetical protein GX259_04045 [Bacteroidales bacterium]|nr:hypothetical protein [Bacteroidales bacterium]